MQKNTENKHSSIVRFLRFFFQVLLYIPIQLLFLPFAFLGLLIALYKEMVRSKKLGVSFSAVQALQYRWIMHYFDTRPDQYSVDFTRHFPCESHFGLWSIMGPLIISQRFFGLKTRLGKLVNKGEETIDSTAGIRVLKFDEIVEKYVDEMEQIVIPGSGFDLMLLHHTKGKNVKVFELDQAETMDLKIKTLTDAGIKHDWIEYISVDYENEDWSKRLKESGFEMGRKTLFIWQSVFTVS